MVRNCLSLYLICFLFWSELLPPAHNQSSVVAAASSPVWLPSPLYSDSNTLGEAFPAVPSGEHTPYPPLLRHPLLHQNSPYTHALSPYSGHPTTMGTSFLWLGLSLPARACLFFLKNIFIDYAITVVPFPPPLHSILPTPLPPTSPPIVHVHGSYL